MPASGFGLLLLAALAAGSGGAPDEARRDPGEQTRPAAAPEPQAQVERIPPRLVVLKTAYYGVVTVSHAAHLERRTHCRACHGSGVAGRIDFTPALAHDRCRNCHLQVGGGPTTCKGCHAFSPQNPGVVIAGTRTVDRGAAVSGALPPAAAAEPPAPTEASLLALGFSEAPPSGAPLRRTVHLAAAAGGGLGLSARFSSRQDGVGLSHAVDRMSSSGRARTLATIGVGALVPFGPPGLGLLAEALAGVDAVESPGVDVAPALGARLGVEWTPAFARPVAMTLAATGALDLFRRGADSPAVGYLTLGVGVPIPGF